MRWVPILVVLAGCISVMPPQEATGAEFDSAGAGWAFQLRSGCGMCDPANSGFSADPQAYALVVFANDRVALFEWNGGWQRTALAVHLEPSITYDTSEIAAVVGDVDHARDGDVWVSRVTTGEAGGTAARLESRWGPAGADDLCTDTGFQLARKAGPGGIETQRYTCGPKEGSIRDVAADLFARVAGLRERGHVEGVPRSS